MKSMIVALVAGLLATSALGQDANIQPVPLDWAASPESTTPMDRVYASLLLGVAVTEVQIDDDLPTVEQMGYRCAFAMPSWDWDIQVCYARACEEFREDLILCGTNILCKQVAVAVYANALDDCWPTGIAIAD